MKLFYLTILICLFIFLLFPNSIFAQNCTCYTEFFIGTDDTNKNNCENITGCTHASSGLCECNFEGNATNEVHCTSSFGIITENTKTFIEERNGLIACNYLESGTAPGGSDTGPGQGGLIPPTVDTPPSETPTAISLPNFLGTTDPNVVIGRIIKYIIGLSGSVALLIFIYGGFLWLTSQGKQEKIQKGRDAMIYASIGLLIIFSSYIIVRFIISALTGTN